MNEQGEDPETMFCWAACHADSVIVAARNTLSRVREAYEATGYEGCDDGRAETIACAVAMVDAARELSDALWAVVEATRENAEVGR